MPAVRGIVLERHEREGKETVVLMVPRWKAAKEVWKGPGLEEKDVSSLPKVVRYKVAVFRKEEEIREELAASEMGWAWVWGKLMEEEKIGGRVEGEEEEGLEEEGGEEEGEEGEMSEEDEREEEEMLAEREELRRQEGKKKVDDKKSMVTGREKLSSSMKERGYEVTKKDKGVDEGGKQKDTVRKEERRGKDQMEESGEEKQERKKKIKNNKRGKEIKVKKKGKKLIIIGGSSDSSESSESETTDTSTSDNSDTEEEVMGGLEGGRKDKGEKWRKWEQEREKKRKKGKDTKDGEKWDRKRVKEALLPCPYSQEDDMGLMKEDWQVAEDKTRRRMHRKAIRHVYARFKSMEDCARITIMDAEREGGFRPFQMDRVWLIRTGRALDAFLPGLRRGPWTLWNEPGVDELMEGFLELLVRVTPGNSYPKWLSAEVRKEMSKQRVGGNKEVGPVRIAVEEGSFTELGVKEGRRDLQLFRNSRQAGWGGTMGRGGWPQEGPPRGAWNTRRATGRGEWQTRGRGAGRINVSSVQGGGT